MEYLDLFSRINKKNQVITIENWILKFKFNKDCFPMLLKIKYDKLSGVKKYVSL